MSAREIRAYRNLAAKLTNIEERGRLIGNLIARGVGFKEEEEFFKHERSKFQCKTTQITKKKEIIKMVMMDKQRDNQKHGKKIRSLRNKTLVEIENTLGKNSRPCRELRKSVRSNVQHLRRKLRAKYDKKTTFLVKKYGMKYVAIDELEYEDRKMYEGAKIFDEECNMKNEDEYEPCIVCMEDEEVIISEEEKDLLALGPKFCVRNNLNEEIFEGEVEECIIKYRWDQMSRDIAENEAKKEDPAYKNIELFFTNEENEEMREELEEERDIEYAKSRMIYDPIEAKINLSKRRATDQKNNARVIFPRRSKNFENEAKLETLRTEVRAEFKNFMDEKCKKGGQQRSNLTKNQQAGLKSLTERVKNGEIIVVPTDKSGRFAIMSRRAYEAAGMVHVKNDVKVGWAELREAQTRLNGHVAMMAKIFRMGKSWDHYDRIRETIINEGLSVCPLSLLFKDHKGWSKDSGKVPPTRQVAGGHMGMNLHLSEIISDILEPVVETLPGGEEVISSEDLQANFEEVNKNFMGWHPYQWWEKIEDEEYEVCKECRSMEEYEYIRDKPEVCKCEELSVSNDKTGRLNEMETERKIKVTGRFLMLHRRAKWVEEHKWRKEDKYRKVRSTEVNQEDIQDFTSPMVIIGSDVISLYPNLDVTQVSKEMETAILESEITWEEVDYLEGARYIALNWSKEECERSSLRRVLPRRRGKTGTRPGIKGAGPRGRERGDQEQWIFAKNLKLTEKERKEIIATVVRIATEELFKHHYYSFGGAVYHQQGGGPIGLRATCAVARVCMQLFDRKWRRRLEELRIRVWLMKRYMDDSRTCLPPIKPGWRMEQGELRYCEAWREEDINQGASKEELTKKVLLHTMNGIENYLGFTVESGEEFEGGWLPTLDMSVMVTNKNEIVYRQYEKEVSSKRTVQKTSAMGENTKVQILSQDMIRRLLNTSESLGAGAKEKVVDDYSQKLMNSGYSREQTAKIVVNGIKGYESKRRRRIAEGRELRTTAAGSRVKRYREKLLGKTTWFKTQNKKDKMKKSTSSRGKKGENYKESTSREHIKYSTVLFVDNTEGGELVTRMKDLTRRLSASIGIGIKVVERNGNPLRSRFSLNNLWDGAPCGRGECTTCTQGAELLPKCTKSSVVYENICRKCNEEAGGKKELEVVKEGSTYVGESSRTLYERGKEHHKDWESKKERSHILKHQGATHPGEEPDFVLRPVRYYRTALSRQVGEAVRIRRRGGAGSILNSKAEFDRCWIPRLVLEQVDEEEEERLEKQREQEEWEKIEEQANSWGEQALQKRKEDDQKQWKGAPKTTSGSKRFAKSSKEQRKMKRRKYNNVEEDWGTKEIMVESHIDMEPSTKDVSQTMGTLQSRMTDFISVEASPARSTTAPTIIETEEQNMSVCLPVVVQQDLVCKNDDRGRCRLHGSEMIKLNVSKQVWCDRGKGRGYGWRTKKVPKYICRDKKNVPEVPNISTKSSDRADCYSSPVQNSSAGLGGGISDRVNPIILESSTGQVNTKD